MPNIMWMAAVGMLTASLTAFAQDSDVNGSRVRVAPGCGGSERSALPQEQQLGDVRFLTGGIGVDEARAMRAMRGKYPLAMTFLLRYGDREQFLADILVEIHDAEGRPVLCVTSDGPYLFVDLAPGEYRIRAATGGGREIVRAAKVAAGGRRDLTFVWPASAAAH